MRAVLLAALGLVGWALIMAGLYGVVGYSVTRRIREIGVRVALGATPIGILRLEARSINNRRNRPDHGRCIVGTESWFSRWQIRYGGLDHYARLAAAKHFRGLPDCFRHGYLNTLNAATPPWGESNSQWLIATLTEIRRDDMPIDIAPNLYELHGDKLQVTCSTTNIAGQPTFTFQQGRKSLTLKKSEIKITKMPIGTLVTVLVETVPDLKTITFSLALPDVNLQQSTKVNIKQ